MVYSIHMFSTNGKLICTDPCYVGYKPGLQSKFDVKPGVWFADKTSNEGRTDTLMIWHENVRQPHTKFSNWEKIAPGCGVDSGQFGFFDADEYGQLEDASFEYQDGTFYGTMCTGTLSDDGFAGVSFGVATGTAYGDGSYPVYVQRNNNGVIVAVMVDYMSCGDEEDFDEDE